MAVKVVYINMAIIAGIVLLGTVIVVNGVTFADRHALAVEQVDPVSMSVPCVVDNQAVLGSVEDYTRVFTKKRLFRPLKTQKRQAETVITIDELTRDYLLIGIVKQAGIEAVIKNRRTNQTFFVSKGATLNNVKVEQILGDSIVLTYNGEKKELRIQ